MPIARVNGTAIHYHVEGDGVPVVFIHPPLLCQNNFNYQKAQLAGPCKVITFDIRGHGSSSFSPQPVTYPLIVEDMKQLLDYLRVDKAFVCGYSTGGSIALEAMLTHPGRFIGGILLSTMPESADWMLRVRIRLGAGLAAMRAMRLLALSIAWGNADSRTTFKNLYGSALQGNIANIRQYYRYSLKYDCTLQLSELKQPILLLFGEKDKPFHRYARVLRQRLPNSTLLMIPGATHHLPTKAALRTNELIQSWILDHRETGQPGKPADRRLATAEERASALPGQTVGQPLTGDWPAMAGTETPGAEWMDRKS